MSLPTLDMYDDPSLGVLARHLGRTGGSLPEKLASLQPEPEKLAKLPDRLFALVGSYEGEKLRKYAMHDESHLATSILYFLETGGVLPDATRAKVAQNLITACGWYGSAPPQALTKVAFLGSAVNTAFTAMEAPGRVRAIRGKNMDINAGLRAAQMSGVKEAQRGVHAQSESEASAALDRFIRGDEDQSAEKLYDEFGDGYPNPFADPKGIFAKEADLRGTEIHSAGGLSNDPRTSPPQKRFATAPKVATLGDVDFLSVDAPPAAASTYALPHRGLYPIDTEGQVKKASDYFCEYYRDFEEADRRIFAMQVAARAEDLGVKVASQIERMGADSYGPHIVPELMGRINAFEGTEKAAAYEVMLEHIDATPPAVMYDLLKLADRESGMDAGYGRPVTGMRDPLSAVFGAPERPIYSWSGRGQYVTEEILRSYAKLTPDLDPLFGKDWSPKFIDDPVKEFQKLPDARKIIIARLANGEAFRFI